MLQKDLQNLGFSKNTAQVYLALFEFGETKAGQIIRKTGMHRNLVYRALKELEQKDIIAKKERQGVAWFCILDPTHLMNELKEKKQLANRIIESLQSVFQANLQEIVVHNGIDEMQSFYIRESARLKTSDEWLSIGFVRHLFVHTPGYLEKYTTVHKAAGFKLKSIIGTFTKDNIELIKRLNTTLPGLFDVRVNPDIPFNSIEVNILPDKVVICIFVEPYTVIEIKNKKFVDAYRIYFFTAWNQDVKTFHGKEGIQLFLDELLHVSDVYWIGSGTEVQVHYPDLWNDYKKKQLENKVHWHDISVHNKDIATITTESILDDSLYEHHYVPKTLVSPNIICIYGKKVADVVWKEGIVTIMENEEVAKKYKKYFDYILAQQTVIYTGWEELHQLFFDTILPTMKSGMVEYVIASGCNILDDKKNNKEFIQFLLNYNTQLAKSRFEKRIIMCETGKKQLQDEMNVNSDTRDYTNIRFISDEHISPLETHIFPNHVVLIAWTSVPTAIVYTKLDIRKRFLKQFEFLWIIGKE